jgi:hypothetical protein
VQCAVPWSPCEWGRLAGWRSPRTYNKARREATGSRQPTAHISRCCHPTLKRRSASHQISIHVRLRLRLSLSAHRQVRDMHTWLPLTAMPCNSTLRQACASNLYPRPWSSLTPFFAHAFPLGGHSSVPAPVAPKRKLPSRLTRNPRIAPDSSDSSDSSDGCGGGVVVVQPRRATSHHGTHRRCTSTSNSR